MSSSGGEPQHLLDDYFLLWYAFCVHRPAQRENNLHLPHRHLPLDRLHSGFLLAYLGAPDRLPKDCLGDQVRVQGPPALSGADTDQVARDTIPARRIRK